MKQPAKKWLTTTGLLNAPGKASLKIVEKEIVKPVIELRLAYIWLSRAAAHVRLVTQTSMVSMREEPGCRDRGW